jgi:hypothetical protein
MLYILGKSVESLCERNGLSRIGLLTLTFAEDVSPAKAQERFHSLCTHVLSQRYREYIRVYARTQNGRIHYHVLLVLDTDIRSGCDFAAIEAKDYASAPAALREEWSFWRATAATYGFGRAHFLPIEKNAETIANYLKKNVAFRAPEDKGVRLVAYSRGTAVGSASFCWNTPAAREWRTKCALFGDVVGCTDPPSVSALLDRYWAFKYERLIDFLTAETAAPIKRILGPPPKKGAAQRAKRRFIAALSDLQRAIFPRSKPYSPRKTPTSRNSMSSLLQPPQSPPKSHDHEAHPRR